MNFTVPTVTIDCPPQHLRRDMDGYPYRIEVDHPQDHLPDLTVDGLKAAVEGAVDTSPPAAWSTAGYPNYLLHFTTAGELKAAAEKLLALDLLFVLIVPSSEYDTWENDLPVIDPTANVSLASYGATR